MKIISNTLTLGDPAVAKKVKRMHKRIGIKAGIHAPKIKNTNNLTLQECGQKPMIGKELTKFIKVKTKLAE